MEKKFMKIEYMKKKEINLDGGISEKAKAILDNAGEDDNLILRVSINSPVFIEDAAPLTKEGIVAICKEC